MRSIDQVDCGYLADPYTKDVCAMTKVLVLYYSPSLNEIEAARYQGSHVARVARALALAPPRDVA